jgi:hypothetical protein
MRQVVLLGLLVSLAFPFDGYAQYDMVAGSTRLEPTALSNGDSARKQTFQILPRRVARYKNYLATVIRDDQTGLVWFVYEGADSIQATQPTRNWIIAKEQRQSVARRFPGSFFNVNLQSVQSHRRVTGLGPVRGNDRIVCRNCVSRN